MESIKNLYKIGHGPSSSHTMGPAKAAEIFYEKNKSAQSFRVTLYGSLALTGRGHFTDVALIDKFRPTSCEIIWKPEELLPLHTNGMKFEAISVVGEVIDEWIVYSIGGGEIMSDTEPIPKKIIYEMTTLTEIMEWCGKTGKSYWEYVLEVEESDILDYLYEIWRSMQITITRGIETEGVLPGGLGLQRKAYSYYTKGIGYKDSLKNRAILFAYALATAEENAAGGIVVTAPTCGSSGVLPAVLYYIKEHHSFSDKSILRALATAGLIGNLVKKNASIAGAEVGCQGEIGTACSMASAAANQIFGGSIAQIEYAAEIGLEHYLGLTCDPVGGFVQIPCIERNAFAAARAMNCNVYSMLSDGKHRVHFDRVVEVMKQTGKDLPSLYKETSLGGLAAIF